MTYFVYILKCTDNSFYTGVTNDVHTRFSQHQTGSVCSYTKSRRPLILVYYHEFNNIHEAINAEKQIKGWSRKKKIALINGDIAELIRLSNYHPSSSSG